MTPEQLPECWQPEATAKVRKAAARRRSLEKRRAIASRRHEKACLIASEWKDPSPEVVALRKLASLEQTGNSRVSLPTFHMAEYVLDGREIDALGRVLPRRDEHGRFRCE